MGLFSSKKTSDPGSMEKTADHNPAPESKPTAAAGDMTSAPQNGSAESSDSRPDISAEDAKKHAAVGKQLAAAFGEIVTLLMRSERDRKRPISDLEWMIAPAVATGQFAIADAQSKKTGAISPIGAVLWAMVSEDIDKRLSDTNTEQAPLKLQEWRSGNVPWIMLAIGDKRVIAGLVKKLTSDAFKGQAPKIRSRNADGNVVIGRIQTSDESASSSA